MNQIYGFEGEVRAKYTAQMYELFSEVFEWLPLAQCINGKVLVRTHRDPRAPSPACCLWGPHVGRQTCWGSGWEDGVWPAPPLSRLSPP